MSKDIHSILDGWDYDQNDLQVRIVAGDDGRDKIQMRIDMGVIQMELSGRPDGTRPDGFESLLDALETRSRTSESAAEPFSLDGKSCQLLMREGFQYYQRYLSAFHLQRYDLVVRDTERNLRLFAFVVASAIRQRDKLQFDRYRPYVTMMRSRALGHQALAKNDYQAALIAIDEGIEGVRKFLRDYEETENALECMELAYLLRWRKEVESERPVCVLERLETQLARAVALEDYEEAARIRDQIQRLKIPAIPSRPSSS